MGNWRALLAGLLLGIALGLWVLSRLEPRPAGPAVADAGLPTPDAGPVAPVRQALWAVPELDLRTGPALSESFAYPVCGAAEAYPTPGDLDGGRSVELGPPGGCAGAVVTSPMHPALLELLSQRSGLLETPQGWLSSAEVPFVSALVLQRADGATRAPLPMVNPRLVYRSAEGTELLLLDDDGACPSEALLDAAGLDGGTGLRTPPLPTGRLLRVRLAEGLDGVRVEGGWRRTCGE